MVDPDDSLLESLEETKQRIKEMKNEIDAHMIEERPYIGTIMILDTCNEFLENIESEEKKLRKELEDDAGEN